ncbi:hypothetical protein [Anaerosporobacter faecicola]|uniref:hypothetical protein n=1 Tax=Anaerosporobacter faecicola TaxID=2718714 RepID=UPI00143876C8|nr:hypothetical protein [Anaerosporobacter faecicola]
MKWKEFIRANKLLPDIINVVLGLVVIVLFVLVIVIPDNYGLMAALMIVSGLMSMSNSLRKSKVEGQKRMCVFYGIVGFIIFAFGLYYFRLALA